MIEAFYIHIPFCLSKCPYCAFNSFAGQTSELIDEYVAVLASQIRQRFGESDPLQSIFFGGGTPTILSEKNLLSIFDAINTSCQLSENAEISIEANPKTVTLEKLQLLRQCGVNRLSIGVQSFNDNDLEVLGRPYRAADINEIITMATTVGFNNLSIDLMYGIPGQTTEVWKKNLSNALQLPIKHLSMYQLTVEEETPFEILLDENRLRLPTEEEVESMDDQTMTMTTGKGMNRYEISNYALEGYQCRHNKYYWKNEPYWGLGAGAVEYINGERRWYEPDPVTYVKKSLNGNLPLIQTERLNEEESFRETVIMGLRLVDGISLSSLRQRFNIDIRTYYGEVLDRLIDLEMINLGNDTLCLTEKGMRVANSVMAELV